MQKFEAIHKKYFIRMGLIWAATFLVVLVLHMLLLGPQKSALGSLGSQLAEKQQTCQAALGASSQKKREELLLEMQELEARLNSFAVDAEQSTNIGFDITELAKQRDVGSYSIKSRDNIKIEDCEKIGKSEFYISFVGDFMQFATFVNALERNNPVVLVDTFKIERGATEQEGNEVVMSCTIFVTRETDSQI